MDRKMTANSVSRDTLPIVLLEAEMDARASLMSCLGDKDAAFEVPTFQTLGDGLKAIPSGPVLLPLRSPALAVATHMAQGVPLDEALLLWQKQAKEVFRNLKARRRDVTLVSLEGLLGGNSVIADVLKERFGIEILAGEPLQVQDSDVWFASIALEQDPKLRALADSMLAFAIGTPSTNPASFTMKVWEQVSELKGELSSVQSLAQKMTETSQDSESERGLLRENLAIQISHASENDAKIESLTEENELLRASLESQLARVAANADALDHLKSERDETVDTMAQEADLLRASLAANVSVAAENHGEFEAIHRERELMRGSLRALLSELQESMLQLEAAKNQLGTAQNELVELHVLKAENEAQLRRLRQSEDLRTAREEVLARSMLQLQSSFNRKTQELEELAAHLDRVYDSTSWRITSPIRAVRTKLQRRSS